MMVDDPESEISSRMMMEMPFLFRVLGVTLMDRLTEFIKPFGIKRRETRYIAILSFMPLTQKEMCEILKIDKANTARAIDTLRRDGFVENGEHGAGRTYQVCLTDKGKAVAGELRSFILKTWKDACGGIENEDAERFMSFLERVCRNLCGEKFDEDLALMKDAVSDRNIKKLSEVTL